jgi:uncharacterized iron-regulated membrane protein
MSSPSRAVIPWGRKIHHWLSALVLVPSVLVFSTGILLQLRQDVEWIQPKAREGRSPGLPSVTWDRALETVRNVEASGIRSWSDISSVDIKPAKGVMSFRAKSGFEVQIDATTGEVLTAGPRRTGFLIELHQGSYFHPRAMNWVFLPVGLGLLGLSLTGVLLLRKRMFLPVVARK